MSSIDRPPRRPSSGNSPSSKRASRRRSAPRLSRVSPRPACRPDGSRPGTIRICAPQWRMRRRFLPRRRRPTSRRRALRLARRERFAPGAQLVLLGGRYIGELSDRLPDRGHRHGGSRRRRAGRRSAGGAQRGAEPLGLHDFRCARGRDRRADHDPSSGEWDVRLFGLFALRHCPRRRSARLIRRGIRRRSSPASSATRRRS